MRIFQRIISIERSRVERELEIFMQQRSPFTRHPAHVIECVMRFAHVIPSDAMYKEYNVQSDTLDFVTETALDILLYKNSIMNRLRVKIAKWIMPQGITFLYH